MENEEIVPIGFQIIGMEILKELKLDHFSEKNFSFEKQKIFMNPFGSLCKNIQFKCHIPSVPSISIHLAVLCTKSKNYKIILLSSSEEQPYSKHMMTEIVLKYYELLRNIIIYIREYLMCTTTKLNDSHSFKIFYNREIQRYFNIMDETVHL